MSKIAFITSTGLRLRDHLSNVKTTNITTVYGDVPVQVGNLFNSLEVVSLIRSGGNLPVPPHKVNYRANMLALQHLGVEWILATSVVGGLQPSLSAGQLVLVDQFLDFTRHRPGTVFGSDRFQFMDFTEPYCPTLRHFILDVAKQLGISILPSGCYVGVDGPRYETAAEVRMYQMLGGDVIGMSNIPETIFARELGLHYSTVAVIANPGAGLSSSPVLIEDINAATTQANERLLNLLFNAGKKIENTDKCSCIPETRMIVSTPLTHEGD